jgi:hypothetical protein
MHTPAHARFLPSAPQTGVAIDHFAAVVISDGHFNVVALPDRTGSVRGLPGLVVKRAAAAEAAAAEAAAAEAPHSSHPVEVLLEVPGIISSGEGAPGESGGGLAGRPLADLFHAAAAPVVQDPLVSKARQENPCSDL